MKKSEIIKAIKKLGGTVEDEKATNPILEKQLVKLEKADKKDDKKSEDKPKVDKEIAKKEAKIKKDAAKAKELAEEAEVKAKKDAKELEKKEAKENKKFVGKQLGGKTILSVVSVVMAGRRYRSINLVDNTSTLLSYKDLVAQAK